MCFPYDEERIKLYSWFCVCDNSSQSTPINEIKACSKPSHGYNIKIDTYLLFQYIFIARVHKKIIYLHNHFFQSRITIMRNPADE